MTTAVFVCRRCSLGLVWSQIPSLPGRFAWRHRSGQGLRTCGQAPDPVERMGVDGNEVNGDEYCPAGFVAVDSYLLVLERNAALLAELEKVRSHALEAERARSLGGIPPAVTADWARGTSSAPASAGRRDMDPPARYSRSSSTSAARSDAIPRAM